MEDLIESIIIVMQIENAQFSETTEALDFSWILLGDGSVLGSGSLSVPNLAPQSSHLINMESSPWFTLWSTCAAKETFLSVHVTLRDQTRWAKAGHVLASAQVCLPQTKGFVSHVCFVRLILFAPVSSHLSYCSPDTTIFR